MHCRSVTSLRSSRAVAVVLVTVAMFTDLIAYSIAVPVLPDLGQRLGASPTTLGLLFASFGVTLLTVSMPMGAISDRVGRKGPLVGGLIALAASTLSFALVGTLGGLFAARLAQGAADAVTWVVGLALIADLYGPADRGRVMGMVMAGAGVGLMIGPSIGGWLYELGGTRLPFAVVAALAAADAAAFMWLRIPERHADRERLPIAAVISVPAIASCAAAVVAAAATISMLEPVLPLFLSSKLGLGPARIGFVFGAGAVVSTLLNPVSGRMSHRFGARRLTMTGLLLIACVLPLLTLAWSFQSALALYALQAATFALAVTPSLAYMAEATSDAGLGSFGVTYGLYNVAWGAGLLGGPALGGFLFERLGFSGLTLVWAPVAIVITLGLARIGRPEPDTARV
jgi:multidrug resistance protein